MYPEWRQGKKSNIKLLHILNHTSGIQNIPNADAEIFPAPNVIKLSLSAEVDFMPGLVFSYNNKAVNLLAGVVEIVSGRPPDKYCQDEFFDPMGISDFKWYHDESGNQHALAGLTLKARDLAKFGQLVLQNGKWIGVQLISSECLDEMLSKGQNYYPWYGLLWWRQSKITNYYMDQERLSRMKQLGIEKEYIDILQKYLPCICF